jgi:hypothetical protein
MSRTYSGKKYIARIKGLKFSADHEFNDVFLRLKVINRKKIVINFDIQNYLILAQYDINNLIDLSLIDLPKSINPDLLKKIKADLQLLLNNFFFSNIIVEFKKNKNSTSDDDKELVYIHTNFSVENKNLVFSKKVELWDSKSTEITITDFLYSYFSWLTGFLFSPLSSGYIVKIALSNQDNKNIKSTNRKKQIQFNIKDLLHKEVKQAFQKSLFILDKITDLEKTPIYLYFAPSLEVTRGDDRLNLNQKSLYDELKTCVQKDKTNNNQNKLTFINSCLKEFDIGEKIEYEINKSTKKVFIRKKGQRIPINNLVERSLINISNNFDFIHFIFPAKNHRLFVYFINTLINPFLKLLFAFNPDML